MRKNSKGFKILDCTLRDGGYYTNWDFKKNVVDSYIESANILPIDYLEIGYRSNPSKGYLGKYGYLPMYELEDIRSKLSKKIAVMLNEKNIQPRDLDYLLKPITGLADMVRLAIDPKNFDRAIVLAEAVKKLGFEVGFNTMYMSKWKEYDGFLSKLKALNDIADLFCMVDSYGGVDPEDIKECTAIVRENTTCPVGFHGHNNLQMGLINTITAIESGVDFVDATILGMGRGAGNLNMELLLTYLNKKYDLDVDFNALGDVITSFTPLHEEYKWGTNLPYMLSGAHSLPQEDVMDWVTNRTYSFNSIVRALDNKKKKVVDNAKFPILSALKYDKVIIIGGGTNSISHIDAIKAYIKKQKSVAVVHATSRHASYYEDLKVPQFYCLVGSEGKRLQQMVDNNNFTGTCVLAPYPRVMGTDVPSFAEKFTFEIPEITFTSEYQDSCTTIALQTALFLTTGDVEIIGYDGYKGNILSEKEATLTAENRTIFIDYEKFKGERLVSLTPTIYKELKVLSIYQFV